VNVKYSNKIYLFIISVSKITSCLQNNDSLTSICLYKCMYMYLIFHFALYKLLFQKHSSTDMCLLNVFEEYNSENKMNCELMLTYDTPALRQTGSRNLTGQKTLPTIWGTYLKLVTKYQISAINSC
jgi:hypothetical protein